MFTLRKGGVERGRDEEMGRVGLRERQIGRWRERELERWRDGESWTERERDWETERDA